MNDRAAGTVLVIAPIGLTLLAVAGCQAGTGDTGCQVAVQAVLPGTTPLPLLDEVRIDHVAGTSYVLLGPDATAVRWTTIDTTSGAVGTEQAYTLPPGTIRAFYGLAGVNAPADHVIIGVLGPAANGSDAELRLVAAPADGSQAPAPGTVVTTFGGGANPQTPPLLAMGTSASAMYAGAAWKDFQTGFPTYVFVDGQGQLVGQPAIVENEPASGYSCLGFGPGKEELTVSYQRGPVDPAAGPTWLIADLAVGGGVSTLKLGVTQPGGGMSCARSILYDNGGSPEYAIVWQDSSGSWLTIYYGPSGGGQVKSFPFASATDFGGADLQPPLLGLATFDKDFGVLYARPHSVELWRVDRAGNRRSGSLVFPSLQGNIGGISSVASTSLLTSTYFDLTGAGMGRRVVVDATCY